MPTTKSAAAATSTDTSSVSNNALVLQADDGSTTIQPHVVAKIAGLAVREVEGVHALVPFGAGQTLTNLAKSISGAEYRDLGVNVEVGKVEAAVDVRIITAYGASIPAVARKIREVVDARVRAMTGLRVKETNIEVVDLYFPGDERVEAVSTNRVQ